MLPRAALEAALRTIPLIRVDGTWWRAIAAHHLIGWPASVASPGDPPQALWPGWASKVGARYTQKGGPPAVYLASDKKTSQQEVNAIFAIPNGPLVPLPVNPPTICQVNIDLSAVLDVSDPAVQNTLETSIQELTGDWRYSMETGAQPPTQLLGRVAHASSRIVAIRAHSAKNPGQGHILAVFADRVAGASFVELIHPIGKWKQRIR